MTREDGPLKEDKVPDPRTISRVIYDIQGLSLEILAILPSHVWILREDYESIRVKLERIVGSDKEELERRLSREQTQHISELQRLARSAVDFRLNNFPDYSDFEKLALFHDSLWQFLVRLTGDAFWPSLAAHLGEQDRHWKDMAASTEPDFIPPWKKGLPVDPYIEHINEAWDLLCSSDFSLIAESADTREWEYYGLKQRCPWCPDQYCEPVEIGPDDYLDYLDKDESIIGYRIKDGYPIPVRKKLRKRKS